MVRNAELTTAEKTALAAIVKHVNAYGVMPSQRELAEALDVSYSVAQYYQRRLLEKGCLREKPVTQMRLALSAKGKRSVGG